MVLVMTPPVFFRPWLLVSLRVFAAVFGGYWLSAAAVAWGGRALAFVGMDRAEAVVLAAMLGFVVYLLVLLWAFAVQRLRWVLLACAVAPLVLWWPLKA
jgi:hypothetical protein